MGTVDIEDDVFVFSCTQTRQWYGYSLSSGNLLWTTPSIESFDFYGMSSNIYRGMFFAYGYGGVLHAYNVTTGKELWTYTAANVGFESPYGNYPLSMGAIADNKIYLYSTEHSPTMPMWRGSYIRCIDVATGHEDWKIESWSTGIAIADGYLVSLNLYDNQIYCYGRGPSATSVSATQGIGNIVTIQGSVTDQTVGKPNIPAISDVDQQAWMEYQYEEQAMPTKATGVPVTIYQTDPNGNSYTVGTVTSDLSGHYAISFVPTMPGMYTFTASFAGSNAYYGSSSVTSIAVGPAASPVVTPTPTQTTTPTQTPVQSPSPSPSAVVIPPNSAMPTTTYIAIGAAVIVIVAAAAALILRRRK